MSDNPETHPERDGTTPGGSRRTGKMVGLVVVFVLLLFPAGYVGLLALVISAFEVGSRILALLAALVAGAGVVCGLIALGAGSNGESERARTWMTTDFFLTLAAVVGMLSIPTHGE